MSEVVPGRTVPLVVSGVLVGSGVLFLLVLAVGAGLEAGMVRVMHIVGYGGMISCAAFACGGFVGFLFGIPRTDDPNMKRPWVVNTNLVEISDWLTKMLVGVSLATLFKVPDGLARFGAYFGGEVGSASLAVLLLCYFAVAGFLSAYLVTRLMLQHAFHHADQLPKQKGQRKKQSSKAEEDPYPPNVHKSTLGNQGGAP